MNKNIQIITGVNIHHHIPSNNDCELTDQCIIVPSVGISRLDNPSIANVTSIPIAQSILFIAVAIINGTINGRYSFRIILDVFIPDSLAVYVNSLSLRLKI